MGRATQPTPCGVAHRQENNNDGTPRKVTPLEETSRWADKLADWAAWEDITELQTTTLKRSNRTKLKYQNKEITGNWRKQTLGEQVTLETTKRLARRSTGGYARKILPGTE
jgi:hypothetical protein